MQRASVDLPQPDSPTSPSDSPCATSRSTPSTARSTRAGRAAHLRSDRRTGEVAPADRATSKQRLRHRRSPRARATTSTASRRGGCRRWRGLRQAREREGALDAVSSGHGQRGWKRQPGGGRTRSGGDARDRLGHRPRRLEVRHASAAARACTDGAARGTPSATDPVSTSSPAYITATRSHVCATTARSWVTKTMRHAASSARMPRQQRQDLVLDRDVEGRRRLVAQQHARLAGERDRDHDPLAQAARQLVRVGLARRSASGMPTLCSSSSARRPRLARAVSPSACAAPRRSGRRRG